MDTLFSNHGTHNNSFTPPRFQLIWCLNWSLNILFKNKVIFYRRVHVHHQGGFWISVESPIVSILQPEKEYIFWANQITEVSYFVNTDKHSISISQFKDEYYPYKHVSILKNKRLSEYHILSITAYYPFLPPWYKSIRWYNFCCQQTHIHSFITAKFEVIYCLNLRFNLLFNNRVKVQVHQKFSVWLLVESPIVSILELQKDNIVSTNQITELSYSINLKVKSIYSP